ncbi:MAG: caspase family protein [Pseudomonadota bacterium]
MIRSLVAGLALLAVFACTSSKPVGSNNGASSSATTASSNKPLNLDAPLGVIDRNSRRTALVIGNKRYEAIGQLENPVNDAWLMASTLEALGFEVHSGGPLLNLGAEAMRTAINTYRSDLAERGGVGAVYFAGHGVQIDGRNWLAPVDAAPSDLDDIPTQLVSADDLFKAGSARGVDLNMVILDACRDNPFDPRSGGRSATIADSRLRNVSSGLSSVAAPAGTLIAFATAPGDVAFDGQGTNSPYAKALAQALREPGERIEDVFIRVRGLVANATDGKQVPWETSSLTKQVVLNDQDAGRRRTARFDGTYFGAMRCDSNNIGWGNPRWARPEGEALRVTIADGRGVLTKGLPEPEPFWTGGDDHRRLEFSIVDDGGVRALGIETGTLRGEIGIKVDVMDLVFSGRLNDGKIQLTGRRGDRACKIDLARF